MASSDLLPRETAGLLFYTRERLIVSNMPNGKVNEIKSKLVVVNHLVLSKSKAEFIFFLVCIINIQQYHFRVSLVSRRNCCKLPFVIPSVY